MLLLLYLIGFPSIQEVGGGLKKALENLPELWNEQQYQDEYDLSGFIKSLDTTEKFIT